MFGNEVLARVEDKKHKPLYLDPIAHSRMGTIKRVFPKIQKYLHQAGLEEILGEGFWSVIAALAGYVVGTMEPLLTYAPNAAKISLAGYAVLAYW